MLNLASSRRFSIAKALASCGSEDPELCLALAEWEAREDDPTVRKWVRRALDHLKQKGVTNGRFRPGRDQA